MARSGELGGRAVGGRRGRDGEGRAHCVVRRGVFLSVRATREAVSQWLCCCRARPAASFAPPTAAVRCFFSPCGLELHVAPAPATPAGVEAREVLGGDPQPSSTPLNPQPSTLDRKQEGGGEVDGDDLRENGPHYLQSKWILWFDGALQVK